MICRVTEYNRATGFGKAIEVSRLNGYVSPHVALDFYSPAFLEYNRDYSFTPINPLNKKRSIINGRFVRLEMTDESPRSY
jgi:hypothetical protein